MVSVLILIIIKEITGFFTYIEKIVDETVWWMEKLHYVNRLFKCWLQMQTHTKYWYLKAKWCFCRDTIILLMISFRGNDLSTWKIKVLIEVQEKLSQSQLMT